MLLVIVKIRTNLYYGNIIMRWHFILEASGNDVPNEFASLRIFRYRFQQQLAKIAMINASHVPS